MTDKRHDEVTAPPPQPLLVYDGDCHFCRHWIARWQARTEDRVAYRPFQEVADRYPEIPREVFQKAVQFITPGGEVYGGAEAVFRTLAYDPNRRWLLWLYEKIPGVASLTEWFYDVVADHRGAFSFWTKFLWGNQSERPSYFLSRDIFLRLLGAIYFIAFISLWTQILGLVGSNGILPVGKFLESVGREAGLERYWELPTLCWLDSSDRFLQLLCGGGAILSLLLLFNIVPVFVLFFLWVFYLSLTVACREFLSFQWDLLLLETGFLAIFLAPLHIFPKSSRHSPPSPLVLWFFRLLLFKLIFSSGAVKLASHDPTWRNLTALNYHYETQPLPTWIGWVAHQLPVDFQKVSCVGMFFIELGAPILIFAPRNLRYFGIVAIIFLQGLIAATGNYCFFNLLTVALCVLLLEDTFWPKRWRESLRSEKPLLGRLRRWPRWVIGPIAAVILVITTVEMSGLFRRWVRWPRPVAVLYQIFLPLRSVNSYGLFAVMTTSRLEIIVEGSNDGITWLPYEFKYKPGDPKRRPKFVAPHQPRLDWQMWFAALGDVEENPWFLNFCVKLLHGSPDVLRLLSKNPFPDTPPRYIRAVLFGYHFTDFATRHEEGSWWRRRKLGPYSPILSLKTRKKSVDDFSPSIVD